MGMIGGIGLAPRFARAWLLLTIVGAGAGLSAALTLLWGAADWEWHSAFSLGGEIVHLWLDGVSALFLALLCVVGGM